MKKAIYIFIFLISCIFVGVGCGKDASISYAVNEIQLYLNESYEIDLDKVIIENHSKSYQYDILDKDIAMVNEQVITPISAGETTLVFTLSDKKQTEFVVKIIVVDGYLAEYVTISISQLEINLSKNDSFVNKIQTNKDCTETPQVTYDKEMLDYDVTTGIVTAKKTGVTTVNIVFKNCSTSFDVTVSDIEFVEFMQVDSVTLFADSTGKIEFLLFPENANTFTFRCESDLINIDDSGNYTTFGVGGAIGYYSYFSSETTYIDERQFEINIIPKVSSLDLEIYNLDGTIANYFLFNYNYNLRIYCDVEIAKSQLDFSDNVTIKNTPIWQEDGYLQVQFEFVAIGESSIVVVYENTLHGYKNSVNKALNVDVKTVSDIQTTAKCSAYNMSRIDGKYTLFLSQKAVADSLFFVFKINDIDVSDKTTLRYKFGDTNYILYGQLFEPVEQGLYEFEVVFDGVVVDRFDVDVGVGVGF